jgi:hypothetical protein
MSKKTWTITLDENERTVIFDTGGLRTPTSLQVEGKPVQLTAVPKTGKFSMFSDFEGAYSQHKMLVRVSTNGFTNSYDLAVDGISTRTGKEIGAGPTIPLWAWLFFAASIPVVFIAWEKFIPSTVGLLAALGSLAVGSLQDRKLSVKVGICSALVILAWIAYFFSR